MNVDTEPDHSIICDTLLQCVQHRAAVHGDRTALTVLPDASFADAEKPIQVSYRELWRQANQRARLIRERLLERTSISSDAQSRPRVLLLYPPGVEFVFAFLGAQLADCIPVPTAFPRPHREIPRLNAAARDCRPAAVLTDRATEKTLAREKLEGSVRDILVISTDRCRDGVADNDALADESLSEIELSAVCQSPESIAFLQYTSGSTSEPNGVVVRQRNLITNLESIRDGFRLQFPSHQARDGDPSIVVGVFWLPFYHDMGLIGGILEPLYIGGHSVLISPRAFLQRPIRWLQTISKYRATISGAPNFAYQLCVDRIPPDQTDSLSLANWKLAFCGAEPITAKTLIDFERRFSPNGFSGDTFYPCYGLAEATLLVAGPRGPKKIDVVSLDRTAYQQGRIEILSAEAVARTSKRKRQDLVACGAPVKDTELAIVDPKSARSLDEDVIGEIWVRGGGVTEGYWNESTDQIPGDSERFGARLEGGRSGFFRTGDLGFVHDGQLFVTGRLKELVILRGRNLFPQDIERTVRQCIRQVMIDADDAVDATTFGNTAAFAVPASRSETLAIVAELPRDFREVDLIELIRQMRRRVIDEHEVDPHHILLVRLASVPLTTSGKIRRGACRELFLADSFKTIHRWGRATFSEQSPIPFPMLSVEPSSADVDNVRDAIAAWMAEWLIARAGVSPDEFCPGKPLGEYGLDSLTAVELSGETEDWTGVTLTPEVAVENPSVAALSDYITRRYIDGRS